MTEDLADLTHEQDGENKGSRFADGVCPDPPPCSFDPQNEDRCRVCNRKRDVSPQTNLLIEIAQARAGGMVLTPDDLDIYQWRALGMICSYFEQQKQAQLLAQLMVARHAG